MTHTLLYLTVLVASCACHRRTDLSEHEAARSAPLVLPVPSVALPNPALLTDSYRVAATALRAIARCVGDAKCKQRELDPIDTTPLLGVRLYPQQPNADAACLTSSATFLVSRWCGRLHERDLEGVRQTATYAAECLDQVASHGPGCIPKLRQNLTWVGSHRCSGAQPGELETSDGELVPGPFVAGKPWAIQLSGVTIAAWSLCLEGNGEDVTGITASAAPASE